MSPPERIVGDDIVRIILTYPLSPDPWRYGWHYVEAMRSMSRRYSEWFFARAAMEPEQPQWLHMPLRVRLHPAVISALGPRAIRGCWRNHNGLVLCVEGPPTDAEMADGFWLVVEDGDQITDLTDPWEPLCGRAEIPTLGR